MGDRFEGKIPCPYCKKKTLFYYAPSSGFTKDICEHCKKPFKICMKFEGEKIQKKYEKDPIKRFKNLLSEKAEEQREKAELHNKNKSQTQKIKYLRHIFIADYLNDLRGEVR